MLGTTGFHRAIHEQNNVISFLEQLYPVLFIQFTTGNESADTTGTVLVPGLAIFSAKIQIYFSNKIYEAILSNCTRKLLWFEITKMLISVKNKFIVLFIIIFGTLLFPIYSVILCRLIGLHTSMQCAVSKEFSIYHNKHISYT